MLNEHEVAEKIVKPHLVNSLGWKKDLVSEYGRVPIQVGRKNVWADYVFYITINGKRQAYLLVEVKKTNQSLEDAVLQAESYSLILHAPFFCATDGRKYDYFITGNSQGNSIKLRSIPPTPNGEYLRSEVIFSPNIDYLVQLFIKGLKEDHAFRKDTLDHVRAATELREKIFDRNIDSLSSDYLKLVLGDRKNIMNKKPNIETIFKQDFKKIGKMLEYIKSSRDDPLKTIQRLIGSNEDDPANLAVKGAKLFFVTQLLSAAHPDKYVALHEIISRSLKDLDITDIIVKPDSANGYVYINEICKRLYSEKMKHELEKEGFDLKLWGVHQFLWHYYAYYKDTKKWMASHS
jgi:hypothetical protein